MNNNNESEKRVYDIPGVIIPPQTTEDGVVISQEIDDSKEVINEAGVASVTTPPISNTPVNVPIPPVTNSSVSVISVTPIENQPVSVAPVVQTEPVIVNEPPVVPPNNNQNLGNNEKTTGKKNNNIIFILIIVLLIMGLGYFVYNDYLKPKEVTDPAKEWQKKRTVNINSLVVKELYSYVNIDGCDDQINFFYGNQASVSLADLSDEVKNYLAYRQLKHSALSKKNCSTYSVALHKNDDIGLWYCGDEYLSTNTTDNYSDEKALTYVISEDDIKTEVEKMFGEDTYKAKTFAIGNATRYLYNAKTSSYIYQSFYGTSSCKGFSNKLDSSYQQGDDLTIVVKVTNNENKSLQMFYYTFTESTDGNYYFTALNKRNV